MSQLSIYDFKKASRYKVVQFGDREIRSFFWSKDCKYFVVALSNEVILYALEKMKKLASKTYTHSLTSISMSPYAHWQMASTGTEDLKLWRFTENELKSFDPTFNSAAPTMTRRASFLNLQTLNTSNNKKYCYTCHVWFDDEKLLVGTEEGVILVVDKMNVVKEIQDIYSSKVARGIFSICSVDRGFICGGEGGYLSVFERTFDNDYFNHYKRFRPSNNRKESIVGMCVSKLEESVIVAYEDNQITHFALANVDILKENSLENFNHLPISFHDYNYFQKSSTGGIVSNISNSASILAKQLNVNSNIHQQSAYGACSSDTCYQKSLVASVSNRTIRIYNYRRRNVELVQTFPEETLSVSLSPTGLRVLIGFRFKLGLFNIERDKLTLVCSWQLKNVSFVQFHGSGDRFLAITSTNILIISAHSFKILKTLRGHSGLVKGAQWSRLDNEVNGYDQRLVSIGHEGAKYEWTLVHPSTLSSTSPLYSQLFDNNVTNISDFSQTSVSLEKILTVLGSGKLSENIVKSCAFRSCDFDGDRNIVVAVGNDRKIYSFRGNELFSEIHLPEYDLSCVRISKVHSVLIVGTNCGRLLMVDWPPLAQPYTQYDVHIGSICCLSLTSDEQFLLTMGTDGSMFMFTIVSFTSGLNLHDFTGESVHTNTDVPDPDLESSLTTLGSRNKEEFDYSIMQDLYIAQKSSLEELDTMITTLNIRLEQMRTDFDRERDRLEIEKEQRIIQERKMYKEELNEWVTRYNEIKHKLAEEQARTKDQIEKLEQSKLKSEQQAQELISKIESNAKRELESTKSEKDEEISNLVDVIREMQENQEIELAKIKEEYENDRLNQNQLMEQLSEQYTRLNEMFEKTQDDVEKDFDAELQKTKEMLHEEIKNNKKQITEEKAKAGTFSNNAEMFKRKWKEMEMKHQELANKLRRAEKKAEEDRLQIIELEEEKEEKHMKMALQEKKILELKKQAEELEKLRYVLTFKFNRLTREVAPKEELIKEMRNDLKAKDEELQKVKMTMDNMEGQLTKKTEKADVMSKQILKYRQAIEDKTRILGLLLGNLTQLCLDGDSKNSLLKLRKIIDQYSHLVDKGGDFERTSRDQLLEFDRQREFLEQQMNTFRRAFEQKSTNSKMEIVRRNTENSTLVEEINQLRKDQKKQRQRILSLEYQLKSALNQAPNSNLELQPLPDVTASHERDPMRFDPSDSLRSSVSNSSGGNIAPRITSSKGSSVITRVRTPDSFFGSKASTRSASGGRLRTGLTTSQTTLDRVKVQEFLDTLDNNNKDFEKQQKEIGKLKEYVENLVNANTIAKNK